MDNSPQKWMKWTGKQLTSNQANQNYFKNMLLL